MTLLLLFNQPASSGTLFRSFVEAGMFLGMWTIDSYLTFTACTHDDTGAAADADAPPTYAIYEDETVAAVATGDMAKLGAITGFYTERVQLTAAAGFEVGKSYSIRVQAVVGGVTAAAVHAFGIGDVVAAQQIRDAMKLAPSAGAPAAGSIDDHLDDVLDALDTCEVTVTSAIDGDAVTVYTYTAWSFSMTLGVSIADRTGLLFTVKRDPRSESDALSMLQVKEMTGALYLNRAAASDPAYASLTVTDEDTGELAVAVTATGVGTMGPERGLVWEVKKLTAGGPAVVARGPFHIDAAVARAVA